MGLVSDQDRLELSEGDHESCFNYNSSFTIITFGVRGKWDGGVKGFIEAA